MHSSKPRPPPPGRDIKFAYPGPVGGFANSKMWVKCDLVGSFTRIMTWGSISYSILCTRHTKLRTSNSCVIHGCINITCKNKRLELVCYISYCDSVNTEQLTAITSCCAIFELTYHVRNVRIMNVM